VSRPVCEITNNDKLQKKVPWHLSKTGVLVMFLFLGPFGLFLLFNCPCFSQKAKVGLTIAVMLYAAIIVAIFTVFLLFLYRLMEVQL
jgi:hypothetical protein